MSTHRRAVSIVALAALTALAIPAGASATTLLSGYGGPGQGSQAILGGGLINGGGKGGGGTPTSRSGAAPRSASEASESSARSSAAQTPKVAPKGRSKAAPRSRAKTPKSSTAAGRAIAPAKQANAYPLSTEAGIQTVSADSDPLGLSGVDLIYILVVAGLVVFMGLLTRQLAQRPYEPSNEIGRFDRTPPH